MSAEGYRKWYEKNREKAIARSTKWQKENKERHKKHQRDQHAVVRTKVLSRYGGAVPKCACCGETERKFLAFDHINGRKGAKRTKGVAWYRKLLKEAVDPNIQILCHNCNLSKGFYGQCPHTEYEKTI